MHTETLPQAPTLPQLEGDRIRLRAFRDGDADALYTIYSDPVVMRYWSYPAWTDGAQAEQYLVRVRAAQVDEGVHAWAIANRASDVLVGTMTLWHIDPTHGRAEVGYALGAQQWGNGYACEALRLAITHAFEALQLRRIEADVDPRNQASCRLLERVGFIREGLLRQRWTVAGELQDSAVHGLLRGELI